MHQSHHRGKNPAAVDPELHTRPPLPLINVDLLNAELDSERRPSDCDRRRRRRVRGGAQAHVRQGEEDPRRSPQLRRRLKDALFPIHPFF